MVQGSGGPLAGVRVLDLTRILSGPFASMTLGDFGADVVKVERPVKGDDTRVWGPPFVRGESAYFLSTNRNKRSIELDLASDAGRAIAYRLASRADVVVENFRPGTAERLGLGYERLRADNPGLVYCSISGFGQTGPYRSRAGFDAVVQAMSGMMALTGEPDGVPTRPGLPVADLTAAMWAAFAIAAALFERTRSGCGQHIDVSLLDGQVAWMTYPLAGFLATGEEPARLGSAHATIVPYQPFATADGHVIIAAGNDKLWQGVCRVIGAPELADDPRFATNPDRVRGRAVLVPILEARLRTRPTAHWLAVLEAEGVPAAPILKVSEMAADPHLAARDMVIEMEHPRTGKVRTAGLPVRFSRTPGAVRRPPPHLGEHTDEILAEIGWTEQEPGAPDEKPAPPPGRR